MGIINRFHRTLKEKLTKYFTANDILYGLIRLKLKRLNHTVNRGVGMAPYKVNSFIENKLVQEMKDKTKKVENTD